MNTANEMRIVANEYARSLSKSKELRTRLDALMIQAYDEGMSYETIAAASGRSVSRQCIAQEISLARKKRK